MDAGSEGLKVHENSKRAPASLAPEKKGWKNYNKNRDTHPPKKKHNKKGLNLLPWKKTKPFSQLNGICFCYKLI